MYGGAVTTSKGVPTAGAGRCGGPFGAGGKFALANVITITIWRDFHYLFFLLPFLNAVFLSFTIA